MTNRADEITAPFVQRLRHDLVDNLPRHRRRRRRRRQVGLGTAAVAVMAVVALATGPGGPGGDDRGADVATESTVPGTTGTTEPPGTMRSPEPALAVLREFLDDVRRGDLEAVAGRWTGYPNAVGEDLGSRVAGVEQMLDQLPWLADPAYLDRSLDAPIWPGGHQVVTVTASTGAGRPRKAAAFVVDRGAADGTGAIIERLPFASPTSAPPAGTAIARGQEIVVPVTLVEAVDVVAWFGGVEVPARATDGGPGGTQTVTVRVPDTVVGQTVLTVLTSTPELPVAYAFWFPVAGGGRRL
jgi:hypothetical protein